jgi:hypothetical protein
VTIADSAFRRCSAAVLVAAAWFLRRGDGERDATTGGGRLETATE